MTTDQRHVLPQCERRFLSAEARLKTHDGYIRQNDAKTTESLVKIEILTNMVSENTQEVKGLTQAIGSLTTSLNSDNAITRTVVEERSKVVGYVAKGFWALAIGLVTTGFAQAYNWFAAKP
ncbi:MAG: DUF4200 domain-containing protein [Magnetococcales bacterium]|nr:DUF4200 domain-containing protein [Magnetococcales bacterium]